MNTNNELRRFVRATIYVKTGYASTDYQTLSVLINIDYVVAVKFGRNNLVVAALSKEGKESVSDLIRHGEIDWIELQLDEDDFKFD